MTLSRLFFYLVLTNTALYAYVQAINMWGGGGGNFSLTHLTLLTLQCFAINFSIFYTILCICNTIHKKCEKVIFTALSIFTFIAAFVEIFLLGNFQTLFNKIMFQVFLSTNSHEASEFLQTYMSKNIIIILIFFTLCSICFIKIPKFIKSNILRHGLYLNAKTALYLFALCLMVFAFLFGRYWYGDKPPKKNFFIEKNLLFRWEQVLYYGIKEQRDFLNQYYDLSKQLQEFKKEIPNYITKNNSIVPKVVLILGESTQRNYMSLYGYPLQTTPLLQQLRNNGNLIVFSDVVAPHAHTNEALQEVLTFSNYENRQTPWFKQQNLIDIMRFAGYKSIWLSNQESFSLFGNAPEALSRHADVTHFSRIIDSYTSIDGVLYDGVLLSMLDKTLKQYGNENKTFYILHLMGTHGVYEARFPKAFAKFSQNDLIKYHLNTLAPYPTTSQVLLDEYQLKTKTNYINAIYYNDYVVSEIMKRFQNDDAIVIYLSDHGDEVYDFRNDVGHSDASISRFMAEVPFMIYMSDTFKLKHKDIAQRIIDAQNLPFMSDDFIHAFFDIIGIETRDTSLQRSLFNKHYNANRKRVVANKDYDKELKTQNISTKVPKKLWLHRVDEVAKLKDFWGKYAGYEIDVHFLANNTPPPPIITSRHIILM